VCNDNEIVSILDTSNENISYISSSETDSKVICAGTSESESGTSDSGSEAGMTYTSRDESVSCSGSYSSSPR
jgi:hypothetical protein